MGDQQQHLEARNPIGLIGVGGDAALCVDGVCIVPGMGEQAEQPVIDTPAQ